MTEDNISLADSISRPEEEIIAQYIDERESPIHIFGEPGVGKTTILERIINGDIDEIDVDKRNIRANHGLNDLFREISHALFAALPEDKKEEFINTVQGLCPVEDSLKEHVDVIVDY